MNVNQVMTTNLKTCQPDTSLQDVAQLMWEGDCGSIPVVSDENKPVGIVTDRDIAMAAMLNHRPLWEIPASTVIQNQQLCSCSQQESVEKGLAKMQEKGVRRLLVTDDSGALTGILTMGDALALTQAHHEGKQMPGINPEHVLGMLRKVSTHHKIAEHPVLRVD